MYVINCVFHLLYQVFYGMVSSQNMEKRDFFLLLNFYKTKTIARIQNCSLNFIHSQNQHWLHLATQQRSSIQDVHATYAYYARVPVNTSRHNKEAVFKTFMQSTRITRG